MPTSPTQAQAALLVRLKESGADASLVVKNASAEPIGLLTPISLAIVVQPGVAEKLSNWRAANMRWFLTHFESTPEKTLSFLTKFSIPDPARLLFLIYEGNGRLVGNIGLCNLCRDSVELDNVVRGESVKIRGFMDHVESAILNFAFNRLHVFEVYLNVLSTNAPAIRHYEKSGFAFDSAVPLKKIQTSDGFRLVPASGQDGLSDTPRLMRMTLRRSVFERLALASR